MDALLGLSTRALKPDSLDLDPRSRFNAVLCELHTDADYAHCTARLDLTHCHARSTACSSGPDGGHVEAQWSLDADPDQRSRVESPIDRKQLWWFQYSASEKYNVFILSFMAFPYKNICYCTSYFQKTWNGVLVQFLCSKSLFNKTIKKKKKLFKTSFIFQSLWEGIFHFWSNLFKLF